MAKRITFEEYISDLPKLHTWDDGATWRTGGFYANILGPLYELACEVGPDSRIIETGAGNTTILFLLADPASLVSICNDEALFARIEDYCREHGISTDNLAATPEISETALPPLALEMVHNAEWIDMALLDGAHGWPTVFTDFCYTNAVLRKGGYMVVDDIAIHAVKELARFLVRDTRYDLVKDLGKTLVFRKTEEFRFYPDFGAQPYIVEKTEEDRRAGREYKLGVHPSKANVRRSRWQVLFGK